MILNDYKIVDLTHMLTSEVPTWNGSCGFQPEIKKDYDQMFRVQQLKMHCGVGTHMDAPSHCIQGGDSIGDLSVSNFIAPLCLVDVSDKMREDYAISTEDILAYEKKHGAIPKRALVIGCTGWYRFWHDQNKYRNPDANGNKRFPTFSTPAAKLLLERDVVGLAIDTLSPDCQDLSYPVHHLFLGAGKYIIENVANCHAIPPSGAIAIALPLRLHACTESPIRLIALVPHTLA